MRSLAAALVICVAACAEQAAPEGYGEGLGTPENPVPEDDFDYLLTSKMDFTVDGVAPAQVKDAAASWRTFSTNPAKTLLAVGGQEDVQALRSALSQPLLDRLEGWINTEVDKARIATKTMRQYATEVSTITETIMTRFNLSSRLTMTPAKTTHGLVGLNFRPSNLDIVVPIGGMAADKLMQYPALAVATAGAISLGDQKFGLAFGHHAWSGINLASSSLFGGNVTAAIATGLNCSVLAKAVAARCYNGACVGHEFQLKAICDSGGVALANELRDRVTAVTLSMFRLTAGSARLVDDNGDGLADQIVDGVWEVELDLGTGLRKQAATFQALQ
ncbi:MAG TPA: hypothetical protein VIV11_08785 [Kofleriaceae bacterium]